MKIIKSEDITCFNKFSKFRNIVWTNPEITFNKNLISRYHLEPRILNGNIVWISKNDLDRIESSLFKLFFF